MKIDDKIYDEMFNDEDALAEEKPLLVVNRSPVNNTIYDWISCVIIALVVVLILLTYVFRLIDVDGTSMEPTLINTDKVVVTDLFYTPHDGDIVVISHGEEYQKPLVKRVIATAGQTLKIDYEKNEVYVDGNLLQENYIQGETIKGNNENIPEVIPEGKVFVMGDNRPISLDSRYHEVGLIDVSSIIGKAQFVIIPHKLQGNNIILDFSKMRYLY
ncbi:MAG: signal peptidase I [Oscillospiraceae bacterium]|nr:signal peptidase I [Candidatus Ruminococcus equi]